MPRRISPLSAVIVVLAGCAAFAAYRSGWIPVEFGGTPTGSILDAVSTPDGLDQPPEFEADDSALSDVCGVTGEGNTKRNESLMPDEPLHWNDSAPTAIRRSKWDTLLEEESAADSIGTQPAVFQKASDRTPSRLRFIAEEQPVGAPKKSEPVTAPRALKPNRTPSLPFVSPNDRKSWSRHSTSQRSTARSKRDKSSRPTRPCPGCIGNSRI